MSGCRLGQRRARFLPLPPLIDRLFVLARSLLFARDGCCLRAMALLSRWFEEAVIMIGN